MTTEVKARAATHVPVDEVVVVVRGAADDVRIVARQITHLLAYLRRDLHVALGTAGSRIDQKLPLEVGYSIGQIDHAAAKPLDIAGDMLREMRAANRGRRARRLSRRPISTRCHGLVRAAADGHALPLRSS